MSKKKLTRPVKIRAKKKTTHFSNHQIGFSLLIGVFFVSGVCLRGMLIADNTSVLGAHTLAKGGDDPPLPPHEINNTNSNIVRPQRGDSVEMHKIGKITGIPKPENKASDAARIRMEVKTIQTKVEIKQTQPEKINAETKDGRTHLDITSGRIKTRLEIRGDKIIVKAEKDDGTQVELQDATLHKIADKLAQDNIRVSTTGAQQFVIQRGNSGAITQLPISFDLQTNTFIVKTSIGERKVAVLPDQAVRNLILGNIINRFNIDQKNRDNSTSAAELVRLGEKNGEATYQIVGVLDKKLLGAIPVQIKKNITVSAETGKIETNSVSVFDTIFEALSF